MVQKDYIYRILQLSLVLIIVLAALVAFSSVALAVLHNINTNDGSVAEWESQGIAVYQTDGTGDPINGGTSRDDIINTWIASGPVGGPDHVYFRLQVLGDGVNPALRPNVAAVARIDCNDDDDFTDEEDRAVVYIRDCWDGGSNHEERVALVQGNQMNSQALGPEAGQVVGNYLEWGVPIEDANPDNPQLPDGCRDSQKIIFSTADVTGSCQFPPSGAIQIDDTSPPYTGWDIPTSVEMSQFEARSVASYGTVTVIALVVGGLGGAGLFALAWFRRQ